MSQFRYSHNKLWNKASVRIQLARVGRAFMLLVFLLSLVGIPSTSVKAATPISFTGEELLGKPTGTSIAINIVPDSTIEYHYQYGTASGVYTEQTINYTATGGQPSEITITGLTPNTQYYYRMRYHLPLEIDWVERTEHSFWTQRAPGSTFTFTVTSDSHATFNAAHQNAMTNILNEHPDFNLDLGDTFYTDSAGSQNAVNTDYLAYRSSQYMGKIGPAVPNFLASGNHENEEGWNFDDTPFSIALGSVQARKAYYPTPIDEGPGGFYSGNTDPLAAIDEGTYGDEYREDYYAWEWGDALFVVIDEFQYTMELPYNPIAGEGSEPVTGDQWSWTLGEQQFNWLKQTLENSDAKYKFIFSHQMTGGIPRDASGGAGYVRGGAEAAAYFEWGGKNADGTEGFASHRDPGDFGTTPIHQLMMENGVSAYFHGHDHQFVYETRDGIVYQEVPSPSMSGSGFGGIYTEGDHGDYQTIEMLPNSGHLRITVTSSQATVDYVSSTSTAGTVNYSYTIAPNDSGQTYTLTTAVSPAGGGTISPSAGPHTYNEDTVVAVTATPNAGYTFSSWSGACTGSGACSVTMDGDKSVTANFSAVPTHVLTTAVSPGGSGTINPAAGPHTYNQGQVVTVTATPNAGYNFSNWSGACTGTGACQVTMDADKTVTANFSASLGDPITFTGSELLGRPTDTSISISIVPDSNISLYYQYGTTSGVYTHTTSTVSATGGQPKIVDISGLTANTRYYYRMQYSTDGGSTWTTRSEHSFQTQRAAGSTFTFDITSDSHVNIQLGNASNWTSTMNRVASDNPDFLINLGDTFAMDNGSTSVALGDTAAAEQVYIDQLPYFNIASASSPIYIVPGNHEQQEAWHLQGTLANSLPVMSKNAEKKFFLNPVNDSIYSGDTSTYSYLSGDQLKQDYFAWTWGDALFVVISPFWTTTTKPYVTTVGGGETDATGSGDRWDWTLGLEQFNWLKSTLEGSSAKYKFVFAHQIVGGNGMTSPVNQVNYGHGGVDSANFVEWGGYDTNGTTYSWSTNRPGWGSQPIRQMLEANDVTAFFHGHDHQFAYESFNGLVYQAVPSGSFTGSFGNYTTGGNSGNTIWADSTQGPGYLRVTVGPSQTTVDFIRYNGSSPAYTYIMEPEEETEPSSIILDGDVSSGTADGVSSISINHTTGTGTDRLMLVGISANSYNGARTISSVTFTPNGGSAIALAEVGSRENEAGRLAAIYSLLNPPSGVSGTVTVTFSGAVAYGIVVGAANFAGVDQDDPLDDFVSAVGTETTAISVGVPTDPDDLVFDTVFLGAATLPNLSDGAGQSQLWNASIDRVRGASSTEPASTTTTTMSWTAAGGADNYYWAIGAVPINPVPVETTYDLTVAVDPVGSGTTNPAVGVHSYAEDSVVNITATANLGYSFDHWSGACNGTGACQVTMDGNKSVTAHFAPITYDLTVAVDPVGGGTTNPAVGVHTYAYGSMVPITATPATGYTFDHWSGACTGSSACQVTMNENKSVTAHFNLINYDLTIAVDPAGSGTTNPAAGIHSYSYGTAVSITATPAAGYTFSNWSGACTGTGTCQVTMDGNKSVTAHFTGVTYDLTMAVDPVGSGTTDPAVGVHSYAEDFVVDLTATPAAGYAFDHWIGDVADPDAASTTVTMDADQTVTAVFEVVSSTCYTLAISHTGQGSDPVADPASSTGCPVGRYLAGEAIDLSGAVPDSGWRISGWTGTAQDDSTAGTNALSMPASNHAIGVIYKIPTYLPIIYGVVPSVQAGVPYTSKDVIKNAADISSGMLKAGINNIMEVTDVTTVTPDGSVSSGTATSGSSINVAHTTGTGTDRLMLVGISANSYNSARTISSVTFTPDGDTAIPLAEVGSVENELGRLAAIYSLLNPPSGVSGTVTVTFSGSVANGFVVGVANFAGVDQDAPLGDFASAVGTQANAISVDVPTDPDDLVFDTVFLGAGTLPSLIVDASQSELWNTTINRVRGAASTEPATTTTTPMSWTASGGATTYYWAIGAVPINPAPAGPTYDLTLAVDPAGGGTTNPAVGTHTYAEDSVVDITATPNAGYTFSNWSGDCTGSSTCQVTMNANKSVTAHFLAEEYTLTVNIVGNGTVTKTPNQATYHYGDGVSLSAAPDSGWIFTGWSGDLSGSTNPEAIVMDGDKSVTATFTEIGPSPVLDGVVSSNTVNSGSSIDVTHTTGTGTDQLMLVGISANSYNGAQTISSVTFTPDGGSALALTPVGSIENEAGRLAAIYSLLNPPSGVLGTVTVSFSGTVTYGIVVGVANFAGVDQDDPLDDFASAVGTEAAAISVDVPTDPDDLVFDTVFLGAATLPSLIVDASQSELWNGTINRVRGAASTEPATTTTTPMSWTASGGAAAYYWAIGAVPINPVPEAVTHNLTVAVNPAGGGTTNPAEGVHSYAEDSVVDITATPNAGYTFSNWSGDCTGSGTCQVTMDADKSVTANFAEITHDLTLAVDPVGGGTTSPAVGTHTYVEDSVVNITATPAAGYLFDYWTGDVADVNAASTTVTMDTDQTVTAHFVLITYDLTMVVDPVGGGTTSPAVGVHNYPENEVVSITATPAAGYLFDHWTGDVADVNAASTTVTMDADQTVTAHFVPITYDLTMVVDPTGGGTTTPAEGVHNYPENEVVAITASPAAGYTFDHWIGDVADVNAASTTVTMDADQTVTAHFIGISHDLTMAVDPVGGGTTDPPVGVHPYAENFVVDLTATPEAGFAFDHWTGGVADENSATTTVTMDADKTVTAHFVDIAPPDTSITAHPDDPSNSADASFSFTSTEAGSTFECQLDGGGFSACTSPRAYAGLVDGAHTFEVRAIDAASNVDPTPASYSWTIDTIAPDTSITAHPDDPSNTTEVSFSFTSTEAGSTFECQLDGGGFSACTSPQAYTSLSNGAHTFDVRAIDAAGNVDPTPASYSWTIDTVPPDTILTAQPDDPSWSTEASFSFNSNEAVATFECQLDGGGFSACTSPQAYSGLAYGEHTFEVQATDAAGNLDPTPASYSWTIKRPIFLPMVSKP